MINNNSSVEKCIRELEKGNHVLGLLTSYWAIGSDIKYVWHNYVKKIQVEQQRIINKKMNGKVGLNKEEENMLKIKIHVINFKRNIPKKYIQMLRVQYLPMIKMFVGSIGNQVDICVNEVSKKDVNIINQALEKIEEYEKKMIDEGIVQARKEREEGGVKSGMSFQGGQKVKKGIMRV